MPLKLLPHHAAALCVLPLLASCAAASSDGFFRQATVDTRTVAGAHEAVAACVRGRLEAAGVRGLDRAQSAEESQLLQRTAGGTLLWTLAFRGTADGRTAVELSGFQTLRGTDATLAPRIMPHVEACGAAAAAPPRPAPRRR